MAPPYEKEKDPLVAEAGTDTGFAEVIVMAQAPPFCSICAEPTAEPLTYAVRVPTRPLPLSGATVKETFAEVLLLATDVDWDVVSHEALDAT